MIDFLNRPESCAWGIVLPWKTGNFLYPENEKNRPQPAAFSFVYLPGSGFKGSSGKRFFS